MVEPGEFVVCTFWRTASGQETMHVYTGFGHGENGKTKALSARFDVLKDHRAHYATGPTPVVKVVRVNEMERQFRHTTN